MSLPSQVSNLSYSSGKIKWDANPSGDNVIGYNVSITPSAWLDLRSYGIISPHDSSNFEVDPETALSNTFLAVLDIPVSGLQWYVYVSALNASGIGLPAAILVTY